MYGAYEYREEVQNRKYFKKFFGKILDKFLTNQIISGIMTNS